MCTSESKINKKFTITTQDPTASHRISHLSSTRVPSSFFFFFFFSFFVSRRTHSKFRFCVRMISRTAGQKIVVQKRGKNTKIELDKSVIRSLLGPSVISQKLRRFYMETLFNSMFEIINS